MEEKEKYTGEIKKAADKSLYKVKYTCRKDSKTRVTHVLATDILEVIAAVRKHLGEIVQITAPQD